MIRLEFLVPLLVSLLMIGARQQVVSRALGVANNCFPATYVGTWRRINKPIEQQMTFWPSGDYNNILYSPGINASIGDASVCGGPAWILVVGYTVDAQFGRMTQPELSKDGNILTLHRDRKYFVNGSYHYLSAADAAIRFRRIIEFPRMDWRSHARDGGYTWDFRHACPPNGDPAYHALIPQLVDDTLVWQSNGDLPVPYIQLEENPDGTLLWQFGKTDRLRVRRFCRPDRNTLIVEQPGPRGISIPHRYDVFAQGGLIYFNGLQVSYRERTSLGASP